VVIVGALLAAFLVYSHASVAVTSTPAHAAAAVTPSPPAPAPTPAPQGLDVATGVTAHGALIAWLVALAILPFFALVELALHARHRARLLELEHPPLRDRELTLRAYDVKALEARRGWLPESFTYPPHMRQHTAELIEEPPAELQGPLLTAQQALDMPGIVYGQRLDTGEPLIEQRVLSLAIGGHPGSLLTQLEPLVGRSSLGWVAETPRETLLLVDQVAGSWSSGKPAGAATTASSARSCCSSTSSPSRCACCPLVTESDSWTASRCSATRAGSTTWLVSCWPRAG
jgi:hypothetical protein